MMRRTRGGHTRAASMLVVSLVASHAAILDAHSPPWSWIGPYGIGNSGATTAVAPKDGPRTAVVGYGDLSLGVETSVRDPNGVPGFIVSAQSGFGISRSLNHYSYATGPNQFANVSLQGSDSNMGGMRTWAVPALMTMEGSTALLSTARDDSAAPMVAVALHSWKGIATVNITDGAVLDSGSIETITRGALSGRRPCKVVAVGMGKFLVAFASEAGARMGGGGVALVPVAGDGKMQAALWTKESRVPDVCGAGSTPAYGGARGQVPSVWLIGGGAVAALSVESGEVTFSGRAFPGAPSVSVSPGTGEAFFVGESGREILVAEAKAQKMEPARVAAKLPADAGNVTAPLALDVVRGTGADVLVAAGLCVHRVPLSGVGRATKEEVEGRGGDGGDGDVGDGDGGDGVEGMKIGMDEAGAEAVDRAGDRGHVQEPVFVRGSTRRATTSASASGSWTFCVPESRRKFFGGGGGSVGSVSPAFSGLAVDGRGTTFASGAGSLSLVAISAGTGEKLWSLWDTANAGSASSAPAIAPDGTILGGNLAGGAFHATPGSWQPRPVESVLVLIDPREDGLAITVTMRQHPMTDWFACDFDVTVSVKGDTAVREARAVVDPADQGSFSSNPTGWVAVFPKYADGVSGEIVAAVKRVCAADGAESEIVTGSRISDNGGSPSPGAPGKQPPRGTAGGNSHTLVIAAAAGGGGVVLIAAVVAAIVFSRRKGSEGARDFQPLVE